MARNWRKVDDVEVEEVAEDHSDYLPPWRERLPDNSLSPWYGPDKIGAYIRMQTTFAESTSGGGLWDPMCEPGRVEMESRRAVERYDADKMQRFVERNSAEISTRELEVFFAFYRDGLSRGRAAKKIGISPNNFLAVLKNLRRRMREARSKFK